MKSSGQAGKKSGLPSTRASDAAERSPAVYFANLKADMLLQRHMQVIKRAEATLVHRITIDQKILFRRFQAKLRRSKIARARLWGDKDAERELRARDLHVLNTNCGQEQDDFDFLKKLERRPCVLGDEVKVRPHTADASRKEVMDRDMEELIQAVMREQVPPPTDQTLQSLTTLGRLLEETQLMPTTDDETSPAAQHKSQKSLVRPATTDLGARPGRQGASSVQIKSTVRQPSTGRKASGGLQAEPGTARSATSKTRSISRSPPRQGKISPPSQRKKLRPLTSPAVVPRRLPIGKTGGKKETLLTPSAAAGASRRKSVQFPGGNSRRASHQTSMFEEQEKVDLVGMRLEAAKATDLSPKVDAFLKSLDETEKRCRERKLKYQVVEYNYDELSPEDVQLDLERAERDRERDLDDSDDEIKGDRKFDYYATKMAVYMAGVKKEKLPSIPGTPEEVNMRQVGNQTIKSLTMLRLHLNFDDVDDEDDCSGSIDGRPSVEQDES